MDIILIVIKFIVFNGVKLIRKMKLKQICPKDFFRQHNDAEKGLLCWFYDFDSNVWYDLSVNVFCTSGLSRRGPMFESRHQH